MLESSRPAPAFVLCGSRFALGGMWDARRSTSAAKQLAVLVPNSQVVVNVSKFHRSVTLDLVPESSRRVLVFAPSVIGMRILMSS